MAEKTILLKQIEKQLKHQMDYVPSAYQGTMEEQILQVRDDVRKIQRELHKVVSGGSRSIVIAPGQPTLIEISSMNTAIVKVMTEDHKGPLQLTVEFLPRQDGDLQC